MMVSLSRHLPRAPLATWLGCLLAAGLITVGLFLLAFSSYCEDACSRGTDWGMVWSGAGALLAAVLSLVGAAFAAGAHPARRAFLAALKAFGVAVLVLALAFEARGILALVVLAVGFVWWVGLTARMARGEPRTPLFPGPSERSG